MNLYTALKSYVNGEIDYDPTKESDDDVLKIPVLRKEERERTIVNVFFSRPEFLSMFNDRNDYTNNAFYINNAFGNSYGYGHMFVDKYWAEEDFKEGYIFDSFDNENINKVKEIVRLTNIKLFSEIQNEDFWNIKSDIASFLYDKFEKEVDYIISDHADEYDITLVAGLKDYLSQKFCGELTKFKFVEVKCQLKYVTNVKNILKLYEKYERFDDDFLEMMNNIMKMEDLVLDEDLYDDYFDYFSWENFDKEGFNRSVENQLDKIIDAIEEDMDSGVLEKNNELQELMHKYDYKYNTWYSFPKQKQNTNSKFKILNIFGGKIIVKYSQKSFATIEEFKMGYDDFLTFLFHPELFDNE